MLCDGVGEDIVDDVSQQPDSSSVTVDLEGLQAWKLVDLLGQGGPLTSTTTQYYAVGRRSMGLT